MADRTQKKPGDLLMLIDSGEPCSDDTFAIVEVIKPFNILDEEELFRMRTPEQYYFSMKFAEWLEERGLVKQIEVDDVWRI